MKDSVTLVYQICVAKMASVLLDEFESGVGAEASKVVGFSRD